MKNLIGSTVWTLAFVATAFQANAQQMHEPTEAGHGMDAGMTRIEAFQPRHVLNHRDWLDLSQNQVNSLESIQHDAMRRHDEAKTAHDRHMMALIEVFNGDIDPAAAESHFRLAHEAGGEAHWAMISAAVAAMDVLTDVQRARVQGWADMMPMMRDMPRADSDHAPRPEGHQRENSRS